MRRLWTTLIIGIIMGCALRVEADLADAIEAIVHDSVISFQDVEAWTAQAADVLRRQYRSQPEEFQKKLADAQKDGLEQLLARQLILHEFKTAYNVPESLLDKDVEERIREIIHSDYGNRMTLTKTLQEKGITYEKFRQQIREQFILGALRQKNISSEIIISPHKVDTYYLAHRDEFKVEDEVKLRMIVLNKSGDPDAPPAKKLAEEILAKLNEGAAFSEMAAVYSQGSQRAGDWGWVEKSVLRKELADVAFSLKPGDRSGVIETPDSCYLMLVEDTRPAHFKALAEVRDQIEKNLLLEERNRLEKQWIERLKKKTFFRYF